ncbi:hypothetical protein FHS61_000875 [Altererythrobacter atlanticus]|uniref:Purine nucleoside phosphorylase n=1 Tax=Croceibacterium atlanticum TaxID=1267766 RepID=A0A0F7KW94_9SPHN|nr:peptidoglycan editing factor PgeF [Croceibacterium atlanticum]AKH43421.1 Laccase domain protein YfiH [Croceibacterium atlanticum]MBB5731871.1 hypothetical protein [Croceibacterium atlanticum]
MADPVEVIRSSALGTVPHGFLGRRGGVSTGAVSGLNAGFGADDDTENVRENRRLAAEAVLPGASFLTAYQVHSPDVAVVDKAWKHEDRPRADALVTRTPGLLLGILTADCAPVLLADADAGVIGAAHAGWRGAHGGVLEAVVAEMERLGARPENIAASIGPAIAQPSYEVDAPFREKFGEGDEIFFIPGREGRWQFDLEAYVARRLADAGVGRIDPLGLDTYADPERFFSYRLATHNGEPNYGRQISLIGLA